MSNLRVFLASVSAIVLFLFGLEGFSHELQRMGGATISKWLGKLTQSRWRAVLLGAVAAVVVPGAEPVVAALVPADAVPPVAQSRR